LQISEEFKRLEPLHEDFVSKFIKLSPYILKYAEVTKKCHYEEASEKFGKGQYHN